MNAEEKTFTSESVPDGNYTRVENKVAAHLEEEGTHDAPRTDARQFRIQIGDEEPATSFKFVVDIKQEEESRLFRAINRRLKRLE